MLGLVTNQYKILTQEHTERHNWSNNDQIENIFNMIFKVYCRKMVEYGFFEKLVEAANSINQNKVLHQQYNQGR